MFGPPADVIDLARVLEDEERHLSKADDPAALTGSSDERLASAIVRRHLVSRTALCLSGGGIRSSSFAIGVMQGLASLGLLDEFDYMSTVSGGGYAGSWLSAWRFHDRPGVRPSGCDAMSVDEQLAGGCGNPQEPEPEPLQHVRAFSRYLDPAVGALSLDVWTIVVTVCRNLIANWLVLLPLLAAAIVLPRVYYALVDFGAQQNPLFPAARLETATYVLLACAVLGGLLGLRFIILNLPSGGGGRRSQKEFILGCLLPIVLSAICLTLYWAWDNELTGTRMATFTLSVGAGVAHVAGWVIWGGKIGRRLRTWIGAAAGSLVTVGSLWFIEQRVFVDPLGRAWLYTMTAVPLVLLGVELAGVLFIAVAAGAMEDDDYEWWARAGAWILIVVVLWLAGGAVVFLSPAVAILFMHADPASAADQAQAQTVLQSLSGIAALLTGGAAAKAAGSLTSKERSLLKRAVFALAAPTFVVCVVVVISAADYLMLIREQTLFRWYPHPFGAGLEQILVLAVALGLIGFGMSLLVNVNRFSLHGMYRSRLIRTFLGASRTKGSRKPNPFTGFDPADNVDMADLRAIQRPIHVLNVTLNVVSTNRLAWQDRRAESFTVSPFHCGSHCLGYRPSDEYGNRISLGTAMTLSGAAVAPNQGSQSAPALTFLLTLFNARLGAWLGNPGPVGETTWRRRDPRIGPMPLLSEMFGRTTDANPYVYLSDGGHFDNIGLYEMVLRRCHYIVISDAGCDPTYNFEDIGNAIRKIRIDLGIPITFDPAPRMTQAGQGTTNAHAAVGTIDYRAVDGAGAKQGFLVYVKATTSGDEPMDVVNYGRACSAFPHEPTTNQWFGEAQFESYRALGFHSIDVIAREIKTPQNAAPTVRDLVLAAEHYVATRRSEPPEDARPIAI